MQLKDAQRLGLLRDKTIEEMEVDLGALVVHEEFSRPSSTFYRGRDYRERAVNRLITMKEDFATDQNIGRTFRKKYITVQCPYCETTMDNSQGSGCGSSESDTYRCSACQASVVISYPGMHAVYVSPPKGVSENVAS